MLGRTLHIEWGAYPYRDREIMNPELIEEPVPGWTPLIPVGEGLKKSFQI
jgi:hypothetical protein